MKRQRGVALITAVLVVAVAVLLATAMLERQVLTLHRSKNLLRGEQAFQYALAFEAWGKALLREDRRQASQADTHSEAWSQPITSIAVPEGSLSGRLVDLDGRFNLNSLHVDGLDSELAIQIFQALLAILKLSPTLVDPVLDWLDMDSQPRPDGAEDLYYLAQQPARRTANRPFAHISELLLVAGITQEHYERLSGHVTALPTATRINVNTASVELIQALDEQIDRQVAQQLRKEGRANYETLTEFVEALESHGIVGFNTEQAGVSSQFFLAKGLFLIDERHLRFFSLIRRGRDGIRVISRSRFK